MNTAEIPKKYRDLYRRAMKGHSPATAIRAQCLICCNWSTREVRWCPSRGCPLWPYRLGWGPEDRKLRKLCASTRD